jgi:hypothetical protein
MVSLVIPPLRTLIEIADDFSCASEAEIYEFKLALKEVWTSYDDQEIDVKYRPCELFESLYQIRAREEPFLFGVDTHYYINENNVFYHEPSCPRRPCYHCKKIVKEGCYRNDDFDFEICGSCAFDTHAKMHITLYKLKKRVPPQFFCSYSIKF